MRQGTVQKRERFSTLRDWIARHSIPMRTASFVFVLVAFIVTTSLYIADSMVTRGYLRMERASERYILAQQSTTNMEMGSDDLTEAVRSFVITGKLEYLEDYFEEATVTRMRDKAVANLQSLMEGKDTKALDYLNTSLNYSNELMEREYLAMRFVLDAGA